MKSTPIDGSLIEDFQGDWKKEWFTLRPNPWAYATHKLRVDEWKGPAGTELVIDVQSDQVNKLVILLDKYAAEVELNGGESWQGLRLQPADFKNVSDASLANWEGIRLLKLSPAEHLRPERGSTSKRRLVGGGWNGPEPKFRNLRWATK